MKVTIKIKTKEAPERVFEYFKRFCIDNLQNFKLEVGELKFEQIPLSEEINKEENKKQEKQEKI